MEVSTYDLPNEPERPVRSRKAAYCALQGRRRRLNLETTHLAPQDVQVPILVATMACRKHHRDGRLPVFSLVCTRNTAEKCR
jgi:hypothetical protein